MTNETTRTTAGRDAARFMREVMISKRAWERGNNSGDPSYLEKMEKRAEAAQDVAEAIAARWGCACTWPGLFPHVTRKADGMDTYVGPESAPQIARLFAGGGS